MAICYPGYAIEKGFLPSQEFDMVRLETKDRQELIRLLTSIYQLGQERGRRAILIDAGLESLLPQLNLEGAAFVSLTELVSDLERFGRSANGYEVLGQFLNTLKESGLVGTEQQ